MRKITHGDAIAVEATLRQLHCDCERGGMCGLIDADYIEVYPFDALLIAIAPYWKLISNKKTLLDFINKWDEEFRKGGNGEVSENSNQFVCELDSITQHIL